METALDKYTGQIIDASQLWIIDQTEGVDKTRYVCRGCGVLANPCSYRPHNEVRPYFKADPHHLEHCDIPLESLLIKRGRKRRLTSLRGFPGSFPNRLELKTHRIVSHTEGLPTAPRSLPPKIKTIEDLLKIYRERPWTANTIRPICRTFLNYPYDRDLPLTIDGILANTYRSAFKIIKRDLFTNHIERKIFYAPMGWKTLQKTEDELEIKLGYGERPPTDEKSTINRRTLNPCRIKVHWKNWSNYQRNYVCQEFEAARRESIEAKKNNKKAKGWVFFIGEQDHNDLSIFHVTDHRLICCIVDELIYPTKKGAQRKALRQT